MATTYSLISSVAVGSGGASSIDFTSIPASYTDLLVKLSIRSSTTASDVLVNFNSTGNNSTWRRLLGEGSSISSDSGSNGLGLLINMSTTTASVFATNQMYIPNYAGSNYKSYSTEAAIERNSATGQAMQIAAGLWSNSAAITSISFTGTSGNFAEYSTAYLYGISNA
jgi:hypothetical protein